jgi:hypothetical protein
VAPASACGASYADLVKAADWKRILEPVLPEGGEWAFRRHLCYRAPVDRILEGVIAGSSSFDSSASLSRVMMPLFIPRDYIVGAYSTAIADRRGFFEEEAAEIQAAVAPVLRSRETEEQALRRIVARAEGIPEDWLLAEPAGYSLVLLGEDATDAKAFLAQVVDGAATTEWPDETNAWAAQRAALISACLTAAKRSRWCRSSTHGANTQRTRSACATTTADRQTRVSERATTSSARRELAGSFCACAGRDDGRRQLQPRR